MGSGLRWNYLLEPGLLTYLEREYVRICQTLLVVTIFLILRQVSTSMQRVVLAWDFKPLSFVGLFFSNIHPMWDLFTQKEHFIQKDILFVDLVSQKDIRCKPIFSKGLYPLWTDFLRKDTLCGTYLIKKDTLCWPIFSEKKPFVRSILSKKIPFVGLFSQKRYPLWDLFYQKRYPLSAYFLKMIPFARFIFSKRYLL